jgi:hypothetical protein
VLHEDALFHVLALSVLRRQEAVKPVDIITKRIRKKDADKKKKKREKKKEKITGEKETGNLPTTWKTQETLRATTK